MEFSFIEKWLGEALGILNHSWMFRLRDIPKRRRLIELRKTEDKMIRDMIHATRSYIPANYEFNKIRKSFTEKKRMFTEEELKFLDGVMEKDLPAVNAKIASLTDDMCRIGKHMHDLKKTQAMLLSIQDSVKHEIKEYEGENV